MGVYYYLVCPAHKEYMFVAKTPNPLLPEFYEFLRRLGDRVRWGMCKDSVWRLSRDQLEELVKICPHVKIFVKRHGSCKVYLGEDTIYDVFDVFNIDHTWREIESENEK